MEPPSPSPMRGAARWKKAPGRLTGPTRGSFRVSDRRALSRNQVLPQSLDDRVGPIACAKFSLCLLQVTADGLLPKFECSGNVLGLRPGGHQAQDGQFTGCQNSATRSV